MKEASPGIELDAIDLNEELTAATKKHTRDSYSFDVAAP